MNDVNKIHKGLLNILKEFMRVCKKHELTWFLDSGSLLGAIRENKLIEWDDDIDVIMPREDYNKLLFLAEDFKMPFKLQTPMTDDYYDFMIRLLDTRITCCSKYDYDIPGEHSLYIDIFPLDAVSDDFETIELESDFLRFIKTFYCMRFKSYREYNEMLNIQSNKLMFNFVNDAMTKISMTNKYSEYVSNVACFAAHKYRYVKFTREAYSKAIDWTLNNISVKVPVGYKEVLEGWYGYDWKTPRQENSGHSFLEDKIYDFEHDWKYYQNMSKEEYEKLFN